VKYAMVDLLGLWQQQSFIWFYSATFTFPKWITSKNSPHGKIKCPGEGIASKHQLGKI
jgi:hypothetical protein